MNKNSVVMLEEVELGDLLDVLEDYSSCGLSKKLKKTTTKVAARIRDHLGNARIAENKG